MDRHLAALGRVEIDSDLSSLEADVWRCIDARAAQRPPQPSQAALVSLFIAVALGTGAMGALATAAVARPDSSPLALAPPMAPATALGI